MYSCINCGLDCLLHRNWSSNDDGSLRAYVADEPTYYFIKDEILYPFCGAICSTKYYIETIQPDDNLKLVLGRYINKEKIIDHVG